MYTSCKLKMSVHLIDRCCWWKLLGEIWSPLGLEEENDLYILWFLTCVCHNDNNHAKASSLFSQPTDGRNKASSKVDKLLCFILAPQCISLFSLSLCF